jgi:DNA-binding MarR family transcriptional regulator
MRPRTSGLGRRDSDLSDNLRDAADYADAIRDLRAAPNEQWHAALACCIYNFPMRSDPASLALEIASDCLASRARRLERQLTRIYDDALRDHGLTGSQLGMLVAIQLGGRANATTIGRRLDLDKSTVSRNVARLAAAGLVDASDGLRITARGATAITTCHPAWRAAQRLAKKALHPEQGRLLARLPGPVPDSRPLPLRTP